MSLHTVPSFRDIGRMPRAGERVFVMSRLIDTAGMLVAERFLAARECGAIGTCYGYVAGHGGDLHWVKHDDGAEACYLCSELSPHIPGETWGVVGADT